MPLLILGLLSHVYFIAYEFVGLADERLGELEAEHRGVEPVEISAPAFGLFDKNVEQLVFAAACIAEYEFLLAFFKNELFLCSAHRSRSCKSVRKNKNQGRRRPFSLSVFVRLTKAANEKYFLAGGDNIPVAKIATGVLSANNAYGFTN